MKKPIKRNNQTKSKTNFIIVKFVIGITFLIVNSCSFFNGTLSDQVIGKYYSTEILIDNEAIEENVYFTLISESNEEFFPNNTVVEKTNLNFQVDYLDGNFTLKYNLTLKGNWEIKQRELFYTYDINNISFTLIETDAKTYVEKEFVKLMDNYVSSYMIPAIKQELIEIERNPFNIIELNENRLVLEDYDNEEYILRRIQTPKITLDDSFSEDFVNFINDFTSNKVTQLTYIDFPIEETGYNTNISSSESWHFLERELFFEGRKNIEGSELFGTFNQKNKKKIVYKLGPPESEIFYSLTFEKTNNSWRLTNYYEPSYEY